MAIADVGNEHKAPDRNGLPKKHENTRSGNLLPIKLAIMAIFASKSNQAWIRISFSGYRN
jgi:hypothetical protein